MSLTLHSHPLASFCQKVLVALYENDTPFEAQLVDLSDPAAREAFAKLWPMAKMPVLRDEARHQTVVETSIIIEYLAQHYPGKTMLVPSDPDRARETRFLDRFYDWYVSLPMQKIVGDRLRQGEHKDGFGVDEARASLELAYATIDQRMGDKTWAMGDEFTMADCSAAPALYYANEVLPFGAHRVTAAYFARLSARPSYARVFAESEPYLSSFPRA